MGAVKSKTSEEKADGSDAAKQSCCCISCRKKEPEDRVESLPNFTQPGQRKPSRVPGKPSQNPPQKSSQGRKPSRTQKKRQAESQEQQRRSVLVQAHLRRKRLEQNLLNHMLSTADLQQALEEGEDAERQGYQPPGHVPAGAGVPVATASSSRQPGQPEPGLPLENWRMRHSSDQVPAGHH